MATVYESEVNIYMNKESGIICFNKGVNKDNPKSEIFIEKCREVNH